MQNIQGQEIAAFHESREDMCTDADHLAGRFSSRPHLRENIARMCNRDDVTSHTLHYGEVQFISTKEG